MSSARFYQGYLTGSIALPEKIEGDQPDENDPALQGGNKWPRYNEIHFVFFLCITSAVFLFSGGATAAANNQETDTASWQKYSQGEVHFTFRFPKDWEIIDDDFYVTAGGALATQRSVNGQRIEDENSDNWIRINPRQFDESDGQCIKVGKENLCIDSKDAGVLAVFKKMVASFR